SPLLEDRNYIAAAMEILERGFDVVVFGHTHKFGIQDMGENKKYANAGSWAEETVHYLKIDNGEISLLEWR
ncbi:MAG: hypothetical protein DRG20_04385, partial [Deltaproteobacteria bacterium]